MQCKMLSFKPVYKIMKVLDLFSFVVVAAVAAAVALVALVVAVAQDQYTLTEINENAVELKVITKNQRGNLVYRH